MTTYTWKYIKDAAATKIELRGDGIPALEWLNLEVAKQLINRAWSIIESYGDKRDNIVREWLKEAESYIDKTP